MGGPLWEGPTPPSSTLLDGSTSKRGGGDHGPKYIAVLGHPVTWGWGHQTPKHIVISGHYIVPNVGDIHTSTEIPP